MIPLVRKGAFGALALSMTVASASPAPAAVSRFTRARQAVRYLATQQQPDGSIPAFSPEGSTADAVVAMIAARRAPRAIEDAVAYLKTVDQDIPLGQKAKIVLALVAAGEDPRDVEGRDLVQEIEDTQSTDGQYTIGPDDFSGEVTSHILAMLALTAADAAPSPLADRWLIDAQCGDGGWQFDQPSGATDDDHCYTAPTDPSGFDTRSDTNTTSLAVQALTATPVELDPTVDPFTYFPTARDRLKGGWVYDPAQRCGGGVHPPNCFVTDANSTSLVIQAYVVTGKIVPRGGRDALHALQYPLCGRKAGAFAFTWEQRGGKLRRSPSRRAAGGATTVGATIGAIQGLVDKPLPVAATEVTKPAPRARACR